jgi:hypothetical protein
MLDPCDSLGRRSDLQGREGDSAGGRRVREGGEEETRLMIKSELSEASIGRAADVPAEQ